MPFEVLILEEAKFDIKEARIYYKSILPSLSKRFTSDLKNTIGNICSHPETFGFRFNEFRTANLSIFPYQVHYIIAESTIIIFAVLHAYRDPTFISSRKR
jgi:plasmid stabilization system protein ParE